MGIVRLHSAIEGGTQLSRVSLPDYGQPVYLSPWTPVAGGFPGCPVLCPFQWAAQASLDGYYALTGALLDVSLLRRGLR